MSFLKVRHLDTKKDKQVGRKLYQDEGRVWSDVSMSQGIQKIAIKPPGARRQA